MEQARQQQIKKPATNVKQSEKPKETTEQKKTISANKKPANTIDDDDDFEYGKVTANVTKAGRSVTKE